MAEKINLNELLDEAKKNGFELTDEQLDGISGGEYVDYLGLGVVASGLASLGDVIDAMKRAKEAGMTPEEFIISSGKELTPDLLQSVTTFWSHI